LSPEQPLQIYRWSSYPWYWLERSRRPVWMRVDRLLGEWGIRKDSSAGRDEFAGHVARNHHPLTTHLCGTLDAT